MVSTQRPWGGGGGGAEGYSRSAHGSLAGSTLHGPGLVPRLHVCMVIDDLPVSLDVSSNTLLANCDILYSIISPGLQLT